MLLDFLIGLFGINALPHYLFGRLNVRILSLFGYSAKANYAYSALCFVLSLGLFSYKYGFSQWKQHTMYFGVLFVTLSFYVGWPFIDRFLYDKQGS
ncbi:MAG: hypothetical protein CL920_27645 [Deltaproteobacteria bacterium]|nr:hypothetical protein [Deltaproteobacteria bacterium]MBU52486.1 hypothetical protein [Deltaproteobacteria bacterium]|tara:strand:- start:16808 stop:17095 length:288 start_codon:yes stop_codon:yes gene_type:complete